MKSLLIALLLSSQAFAALPAQITNIGGWTLIEIPDSEPAAKIMTGHADASLVREVPGSEASLNINVKIQDENADFKAAGMSVKAWRKAVFGDRKFKLSTGTLVNKKNEVRYVGEFQMDTGSETPLHGIVMATIVKGKVYIFTFENDRETYNKNIKDVKKALADLTITP